MLTFETVAVVASKGAYDIDGRTYPYADLVTPEGDPIGRASIGGRDVAVSADSLPLFQPANLRLQVEAKRDNVASFKLRIISAAPALSAARQADEKKAA